MTSCYFQVFGSGAVEDFVLVQSVSEVLYLLIIKRRNEEILASIIHEID